MTLKAHKGRCSRCGHDHDAYREIVSLANKAVTHPLAAAVLQQEADLSAVQQSRCPLCHAAFPCQHSLTSTTAGWANTTQVSPLQARVPLTEEQIKRELDAAKVPDSEDDAYDFQVWRACERFHGIGLETKGDGNG